MNSARLISRWEGVVKEQSRPVIVSKGLGGELARLLSRRGFLTLFPALAGCRTVGWIWDISGPAPRERVAPDTVDITFRRPEDFVFVRYRFWNARWKNERTIESIDHQPLAVTVYFPPQHLDEEAIPDKPDPNHPGQVVPDWSGPPVRSVTSGASRIGFVLPDREIDLATSDPLDWSKLNWKEQLVPDWEAHGQIVQPTNYQTAIELPTGLLLSPDSGGSGPGMIWLPSALGDGPWTSAVPYQVHGTPGQLARTVLWHLRLISPKELSNIRSHSAVALQSFDKAMVRAVWSDPSQPGFLTAMNASDRAGIVAASHDDWYKQTATSDATFEAGQDGRIAADTLALSAAGGWLNFDKHWDDSQLSHVLPVDGWVNRTEIGRDSFVQIEYAAYLYPLGFRVLVIKTTYRDTVFYPAAGPRSVSPLRQYYSIRFVDRSVAGTKIDPHLVFTAVTSDIVETPHLTLSNWDFQNPCVCWPASEASSAVYEFPFTVADTGGQTSSFTAPQLVISEFALANQQASSLSMLVQEYYSPGKLARRLRPFNGQNVVFAQSLDAQGRAVTTDRSAMLPVQDILLAATPNAPAGVSLPVNVKQQAPFWPFLDSVHVSPPAGFAVRSGDAQVAASPSSGAAPSSSANAESSAWYRPIVPSDTGVGGFMNLNNVYLTRDVGTDGASEISIDYNQRAAAIGGMAVPNVTAVGGFTFVPKQAGARDATTPNAGPFGYAPGNIAPVPSVNGLRPTFDPNSLPQFAQGIFDPTDYFGQVIGNVQNAVLFGVNLSDILKPITGAVTASLPGITCTFDGSQYNFGFTWQTSLFQTPSQPILATSPKSVLQMSGTMTVGVNGQELAYTANGSISYITINFYFTGDAAPDLSLEFDSVTFSQVGGQATQFHVSTPNVSFNGALSFISGILDTFQNFFGDLLGVGAPALNITPLGLTYSLPSIAIPEIALGAVDITGISFDCIVSLPFTNAKQPEITFDLSTKENPFVITILLLGGGGFADITANTKGVDSFDVSLQAGAECGINIAGIVTGDAYIFAGIIYAYDGNVTLTAFVTAGGDVSVLGLISASLNVTVTLTYQPSNPPTLSGTAQLTFEVHVLFFSESVTVGYSYSIEGGGNGYSRSSTSEDAYHLWDQHELAYEE
jgi:hypothetical protein